MGERDGVDGPAWGTRRVGSWMFGAAVLAAALLILSACGRGGQAGSVPVAGSADPQTANSSTGAPGTAAAASQPAGIRVTVPGIITSLPATKGATPAPVATTTAVVAPATTQATAPTTHPAVPAAQITTSPKSLRGVNPGTPITVKVTGGTLTSVSLVNPTEKLTVHGSMAKNHRSWTTTQVLGYGKGYTLDVNAVNPDGQASRADTTFSTLTPGTMTMPELQRIGGYPLGNDETYGVGIVPVVHFDEPITNEKAAEKALHITTSPHMAGSWYWANDQDVHWRPEKFWAPGTKVTISADVYGVNVGSNLYGQSDVAASFTIGRAQVTQAYDKAPNGVDKVQVYNGAGTLLRTMNTSMGKHGGETVNGKYINFYTMGGTYTVLEHDNPEIMSSASYGLPADAPGGYAPEPIYYSTRISTGGIFLHELDSTVWAQNNGQDVSHGCLNLDQANAIWFYNHSIIGDPVIVHGANGAPGIQVWQGGDWSVPWPTWLSGSALH